MKLEASYHGVVERFCTIFSLCIVWPDKRNGTLEKPGKLETLVKIDVGVLALIRNVIQTLVLDVNRHALYVGLVMASRAVIVVI